MSRNVVVIGNFDGVHAGHRHVLGHARRSVPDAHVIALTFWPHPLSVIRPDITPPLLTDLDERCEQLLEAGADEVRICEFDQDMSRWSPEEFVDRVIRPLHPSHIVVGENFSFGHKASGSPQTLRELGEGTFTAEAVDLFATGGQRVTSSTRIRHALEAGDVTTAAELQGRPFRVSGVVVRGAQRGRELGFPTANLPAQRGRALPADGVYAGWVTRLDEPAAPRWPAAISVGTNPTFDGIERTVESYVLDRADLELYGVPIAVDFVGHIRGQIKFSGIDDLIEQMHDDVARAREILDVAAPGQSQESQS